MRCWNCKHSTTMTEADSVCSDMTGIGRWEEEWCDALNSDLETVKQEDYDIAGCQHFTPCDATQSEYKRYCERLLAIGEFPVGMKEWCEKGGIFDEV